MACHWVHGQSEVFKVLLVGLKALSSLATTRTESALSTEALSTTVYTSIGKMRTILLVTKSWSSSASRSGMKSSTMRTKSNSRGGSTLSVVLMLRSDVPTITLSTWMQSSRQHVPSRPSSLRSSMMTRRPQRVHP